MAVGSFLRGLASLLAPVHCAACGAGLRGVPGAFGFGVCRRCASRLEWIDGACRRCGASRGPHAESAARCGRCQALPHRVRRTASLLRYRGTGRKLLHRLKYRGRLDAAGPLGQRLAARARRVWPVPEDACVVPVPLHWRRRRSRGFDQAEAIARGFAAELGLPLLPCLRRRRHTAPLFGVEPHRRRGLLEGVFAPRRSAREVRGRTVILVDDIRTSGATLDAAAEVLTRAGARQVWAAVVAR
ncbi:MAG: ComF family protein [Planctomycetota bacterium]